MDLHITQLKNLVIDMDGVLWHGDRPVPGLERFFTTLHHLNIGFVLATNNATKTASQYVEKLAGFGVKLPSSQVLTSSGATAHYLSQRFPAGTKAYVVGEIGLQAAMEEYGFKLLETDDFVGTNTRADVVVAGMTQHVCYRQLASAAFLINHGALFVGTNPDITFPTEIGPLPGAGSILAFLETATGIKPIIIGKPNKSMFEEALRRLFAVPEETAMIGDRLNTDIAGGQQAGLRTILLYSGITKEEDLANSSIRPDWTFADLEELTGYLQANGEVIDP